MSKKFNKDYLRNIIFGAEDSLVSTSGVLFGTALSSNFTPDQIIKTGMLVVFVEALSMGVGSYLSESEVHETEHKKHTDSPVIDGIYMFISYSIFGTLTVLPYIFTNIESAKYLSLFLTLVALFLIGYIPTRSQKSAIKMVVLAGSAILGGFLIGKYF